LPDRENVEAVWERVCGELRREVPDFTFHIWLSPLELAGLEGDILFVRAPDHVRTLVRDRYLPHLLKATRRAYAPGALVEIVDADWDSVTPADSLARSSPASCGLNPKYTFEQFVIGEDNRFAHGAALAVAELPGHTYNPLFIHGEPGLGKTHLLHAIGNFVLRHGSGLTVRYATVEEFTSEFTGAIRRREGMEAFKERFRGVDVLLLDDVQFLEAKVKTEEELFHTFNVLKESGRQLVMTSDRTPADLDGLEQRLGERFASGLVVGIGAPDLHVRRAILHTRARIDGLDLPAELLAEIAKHVSQSARALEAALVQVVAYASLRGESPTPELAARLLRRLNPERRERTCTVEDIAEAAAAKFGVPSKALIARDRRPQVVRARKVAMRIARELTGKSLPEIGRAFGGRDHTTVLSALRSIDREMAADPALAALVDSLRQSFEAPS
jgi:chromosomal replication initiator protein